MRLRVILSLFVFCCFLFLQEKQLLAVSFDVNKAGKEVQSLIAEKNYVAAIELLKKIIAANPKNYDRVLDLADLYRKTEQYDSALPLYDRIVSQYPQYQDAWMGKAYILRIRGQREASLEIARKVLEMNPQNTDALILLANIEKDETHYRESKKYYDEVLKIQKDNVEAKEGISALAQIDPQIGHQERNLLGPLSSNVQHWQLEFGGGVQDFNYYTSAPGVYGQAIYKQPQKYYLLGRIDYVNKFSNQAYQFSAGGGYYVHPKIILNNTLSLSTNDFVVPRVQDQFEIDGILPKGFVPYLRFIYRHYNFADVYTLRPGFSWYYSTWFIFDINYNLAINNFYGYPSGRADSSFATKLTFIPIENRLSVFVYYAKTEESFNITNVIQLGRFHSNFGGGGVEWFAFKDVGFRFSADYENRDNGQTVHTYNGAILYRF